MFGKRRMVKDEPAPREKRLMPQAKYEKVEQPEEQDEQYDEPPEPEVEVIDLDARTILAPISPLLQRLAGDPAWAATIWTHRYDVLAQVLQLRHEACDEHLALPDGAGHTLQFAAVRDVYRPCSDAERLGQRFSSHRLVSGWPDDSRDPVCLQEQQLSIPAELCGFAASQMPETFRAVAHFGCTELRLQDAWLVVTWELSIELGLHIENCRPGSGVDLLPWFAGLAAAEDLDVIDAEMHELAVAVFAQATDAELEVLLPMTEPARRYLMHLLLNRIQEKLLRMEAVVEAAVVGLLEDGLLLAPGSEIAALIAEQKLGAEGISITVMSRNEDELLSYLHGQGIHVGQPPPERPWVTVPTHGLAFAARWLEVQAQVQAGEGIGHSTISGFVALLLSYGDLVVQQIYEDGWSGARREKIFYGYRWNLLDAKSNVWRLDAERDEVVAHITSGLQHILCCSTLDSQSGLTLLVATEPLDFGTELVEAIMEELARGFSFEGLTYPRSCLTAFANGMSVDWRADPVQAVVPTQSEWFLGRRSDASVVPFGDYLQQIGKSEDEAHQVMQAFLEFVDLLIAEKWDALDQKRDPNFEQHRVQLLEQLADFPCLNHHFWQPLKSVHDLFCALQVRADAFSGRAQAARRATVYAEVGEPSSRRKLDIMTFGHCRRHLGFITIAAGFDGQDGARLAYTDSVAELEDRNGWAEQVETPAPTIFTGAALKLSRAPDTALRQRLQVMECLHSDHEVQPDFDHCISEYVFVLCAVAQGCVSKFMDNGLPFPAPRGSERAIEAMLRSVAPRQALRPPLPAPPRPPSRSRPRRASPVRATGRRSSRASERLQLEDSRSLIRCKVPAEPESPEMPPGEFSAGEPAAIKRRRSPRAVRRLVRNFIDEHLRVCREAQRPRSRTTILDIFQDHLDALGERMSRSDARRALETCVTMSRSGFVFCPYLRRSFKPYLLPGDRPNHLRMLKLRK